MLTQVPLLVVQPPAATDPTVRIFTPPRHATADHVYLSGPGPLHSSCGECGRILLRGQRSVHHVPGIYFVCPGCGACNALPG
ncbi:hypothetical protein GIS00_20150 [Nakamurella sp. YIM 132087]|uniref:Uncharacterized protein n=1 Tax=Nakamurella alba TaxID=2665158 RepID=A0A7K1FQ31_9ACTN|nr:hypothetical protein [Nakamurella alba]MTD16255.1 hypothetical protein [Nakamurella alba]